MSGERSELKNKLSPPFHFPSFTPTQLFFIHVLFSPTFHFSLSKQNYPHPQSTAAAARFLVVVVEHTIRLPSIHSRRFGPAHRRRSPYRRFFFPEVSLKHG